MEKLLYNKKIIYYTNVNIDKRNHNGDGISTTGLSAADIAILKRNYARDLKIDDRITKFQTMLKNEHVYRIPLRYFTDLGKINFPTKLTIELSYILKQK